MNTTLQELRLHLAAFIANVINSIPKGVERMKLFTPELRYSLFYLFSSWCELFGISSSSNGSVEQDSRYSNTLGGIYQVLHYMHRGLGVYTVPGTPLHAQGLSGMYQVLHYMHRGLGVCTRYSTTCTVAWGYSTTCTGAWGYIPGTPLHAQGLGGTPLHAQGLGAWGCIPGTPLV